MGARGWKSWLGPPEAPPGHAGNTALLHWLSLIVGRPGRPGRRHPAGRGGGGEPGWSTPFVVAMVMALLVQLLLRSGRVRFASHLFVLGSWLIATVQVARTGGVRSPILGACFAAVALACSLTGSRTGLLYAVTSSIVLLSLAAADSVEALEAMEASRAPIDLLVTDLVMPRMGGAALADCLRERDPTLRVLFVSGYPDRSAEELGLGRAETRLVPKPFTPGELVVTVQELLARPR